MANFFGGFIKRIEKPQDTHPPSVPQELSKYDNEYITYCIEQEKTISELESGLHTNDDPGEIAKKALAAACAFYDADWAGVMMSACKVEAEAIVMFELIYDRYRERPDEKCSGVQNFLNEL